MPRWRDHIRRGAQVTLTIDNHIPRDDLYLGSIVAGALTVEPAPRELARALDETIRERASVPLPLELEQRRLACRQMLRNGIYKPTGRGKPASEYLLRAALEASFPRKSGAVDAINLVSLRYCVPISLWDTQAASPKAVEFRLGRAGERYTFNSAGQMLELQDLVCGCRVDEEGSVPIVTPIKDSMAAKITAQTRYVAAVIYYPSSAGALAPLETILAELGSYLALCGPEVRRASGICEPSSRLQLQLA